MSLVNGITTMFRFFKPSGIMERPVMTPSQARTILTNNTGDSYAAAMTRGRWCAFALAPIGTVLTAMATAYTELLLTTNIPTPVALGLYGPFALMGAGLTLVAGVEVLRVHDLHRDVRHASALLAAMGEEPQN